MFHEQALTDDSYRSHHHEVQAPSITVGAMCSFGHDSGGAVDATDKAMTRPAYSYFMRRMAGGVAFQDDHTLRMAAHDMKSICGTHHHVLKTQLSPFAAQPGLTPGFHRTVQVMLVRRQFRT